MSSPDPNQGSPAERCVVAIEGWLRGQKVAELAPREDVQGALRAIREDDAAWERLRPQFDRVWDRWEVRLREEQRAVRETLSPEAAERLLDGFERLEPYPEAVRTFLRSPAIEVMLGSILYTGIFEFLKKADLFGAIINKLPVIGPIRKKIMAAIQDELEGRLEVQIKGFLGGFSGLAVERMIQFVLSDENREGFRKARRRLGEHLLERPVSSLIPAPEQTRRLRDQLWQGLRKGGLREEDEQELLRSFYEDHGDEALGIWTWDLPDPAKRLLARSFERFWASEAGQPWRPASAD